MRLDLEVRRRAASVNIADHMQVVVIDIDDFYRILVRLRVRQRPTHTRRFGEVNRALVVSVMLLNGSDQRHDTNRIDVILSLIHI